MELTEPTNLYHLY
ncbi:hypothetical protein D043_3937A, partial [Vibrio parahaemolyticus EKP-021]